MPSGFGHELALRLDELGCQVIAGCYTEKGEVELKKKASRVNTVPLDVSKTDSIKAAVQVVKDKLPPKIGRSLPICADIKLNQDSTSVPCRYITQNINLCYVYKKHITRHFLLFGL